MKPTESFPWRSMSLDCVVFGNAPATAFRRTLEGLALHTLSPTPSCTVVTIEPTLNGDRRYFDALMNRHAARVVFSRDDLSPASLLNAGALSSRADLLLLIAAGTVPLSDDAVESLLTHVLCPDTGAVIGAVRDSLGATHRAALPMLLCRDTLLSVGGFDETLPEQGYAEMLLWTLTQRKRRIRVIDRPLFFVPRIKQQPLPKKNRERLQDLYRFVFGASGQSGRTT